MTKELKIEKIREEILERKKREFKQRAKIIFDGKQYNVRIPIGFVKKARLDTKKDEFEFILKISEDRSELPALYGVLIEKEENNN